MAAGFKDATKFDSRCLLVEPVKGLGRRDQIDAGVIKGCLLGFPCHADKTRRTGKLFFGSLAHGGVRFHAVDSPSGMQQLQREDSRPRTDVRDH